MCFLLIRTSRSFLSSCFFFFLSALLSWSHDRHARIAASVVRVANPSGGMILALESGGVFATVDELTETFARAARRVGINLTVLRSSGAGARESGTPGGGVGGGNADPRMSKISSPGGVDIGVSGEDMGVGAAVVVGGPVWALYICSELPASAKSRH